MARAGMALLLLGLAAGQALAGDVVFRTPSGNIGCLYEEAASDVLTCLRFSPSVQSAILTRDSAVTGPPESWDRAWVAKDVPVLRYGESRRLGPFTCVSRKTGLACRSGKHGFSMSRAAIETQ